MNDKTTTMPKRGRRSNADKAAAAAAPKTPAAEIGKQTQAAAPAAKPKAPRTARKAANKPSGDVGLGKQMQSDTSGSAGGTGKQGAETSGKNKDQQEVRGGAKQVLITEAAMGARPRRAPGPEEYPFGQLAPAKKVGDDIIGQSFFIPNSDSAKGRLSAARKRHGGLFWSRKTEEQIDGKGPKVAGLRVWRGTPELASAVN